MTIIAIRSFTYRQTAYAAGQVIDDLPPAKAEHLVRTGFAAVQAASAAPAEATEPDKSPPARRKRN